MSTKQIDALNETAWEIGLREPERSRGLAIEALDLSKKLRYTRGEALAIRTIGYWHLLAGEYEPAHRLSSEVASCQLPTFLQIKFWTIPEVMAAVVVETLTSMTSAPLTVRILWV